MQPCNFCGIDPGQSGGIGVIAGGVATAFAMPDTERDIWDLFAELAKIPNMKAVIEIVGSMPGQGVSSSFKFGKGYGGLRMALIGNKIPFIGVRPHDWQKELSIPVRGEKTKVEHKNLLKAKAQELFPHLKIVLATADALLLAEYLRRKEGSTIPTQTAMDEDKLPSWQPRGESQQVQQPERPRPPAVVGGVVGVQGAAPQQARPQ